jgi:hypothetical protein
LAESRVLTLELEKKLKSCLPGVKETTLALHPGDGWQSAVHADDSERIRKLVGEHQRYFSGIHKLDVISAGGLHRIHLALGVPAVLAVAEAHRIGRHLEADIRRLFSDSVEIDIHIEPCGENCESCYADCPKKNNPNSDPFPEDGV